MYGGVSAKKAELTQKLNFKLYSSSQSKVERLAVGSGLFLAPTIIFKVVQQQLPAFSTLCDDSGT